MPERIQYTAYLVFYSDTSDEFMAKVIVSAEIEKAYLAVAAKSGVAQLDFTVSTDVQAFTIISDLAVETGGVEVIGVYPLEDVIDEAVKVAVKE